MKYIQLLRPKHWIKNAFLFIPLFFAGEIFNTTKLIQLLISFVAFSLVASSIYILNDYRDVAADRLHPVKCKRPLASGAISTTTALWLFVLCVAGGFAIACLVREKFAFVLGLYFIMNLAYCFGLKNISILDIMILSVGFVLRVKAGGVAAEVAISEWLMIMIFLLALFMAIAKRRDDILIKMDSGKDMRKAASGYNMDFLNVMLALVSAVIIVCYLMYTISPETQLRFKTYRLYYTTLFVIGGLLRYLQITYVENNTGSPTKILYKDRFIQLTIFLWVLNFYILIYLPTDKTFFE
ncbi:decaprenyl-phosphate phosphoribosyltransferase [Chitinophaga polysaccharea]|uniref:decaprenyl-phosphate phosphoribosyltransferase n=1 Tax=Chitinophaga TaxID=79328 RepID=UPI001455006D|nr:MULTISPECIES: decaprenyl-phosphate phosphoribosyltransferase [Chitinophaga]NLR58053.1 decaprenyl-phosphate phosphoribosyltransferase [Chitinophaga polysaccharea]NLU93646.1 decaprenyl-phosphate phosphoribosyltransferase [Chitinophaga sp. Ak27]